MTRGDDGWWTPAEPVPATGERRLRLPPRRRRRPAPRPAVAAAARRRARAVAHVRPDGVRVDRRRLDRPPARRVGDLRAARRHVHARGHPRRRDRAGSTTSLDLGVDLVEVMPVNAFNGTHNWGYDGVAAGSPSHEPYGGPDGLPALRRRLPRRGLGVVQDVVYNHLGPSGNYLPLFGPYLKPGRNTWGDLVNLDGEGSAEVRRYILDNVRMWFARLPRRRAAARRRARAQRHLRGAPPRGDGDRGGRAVGPPAPAADPDRRVRPQRRRGWSPRARPAATASTPSGATTSTTPCTSR